MLAHKYGRRVLRQRDRRQGFSLVELVIGLAIFAILLGLAAPSYSTWIINTRVRNAAEAALNGLQLARAEAVRRNATIRFSMTDDLSNACALSTTGANWVVSFDTPVSLCASPLLSDAVDSTTAAAPRLIERRSVTDGSAGVSVLGTQSAIAFNGLGRVAPVPAATITMNFTNPAAGACATTGGGGGPIRCMRIEVSVAGQVRMCDPARNATVDPLGC